MHRPFSGAAYQLEYILDLLNRRYELVKGCDARHQIVIRQRLSGSSLLQVIAQRLNRLSGAISASHAYQCCDETCHCHEQCSAGPDNGYGQLGIQFRFASR